MSQSTGVKVDTPVGKFECKNLNKKLIKRMLMLALSKTCLIGYKAWPEQTIKVGNKSFKHHLALEQPCYYEKNIISLNLKRG